MRVHQLDAAQLDQQLMSLLQWQLRQVGADHHPLAEGGSRAKVFKFFDGSLLSRFKPDMARGLLRRARCAC
jgi:hypothetical protein